MTDQLPFVSKCMTSRGWYNILIRDNIPLNYQSKLLVHKVIISMINTILQAKQLVLVRNNAKTMWKLLTLHLRRGVQVWQRPAWNGVLGAKSTQPAALPCSQKEAPHIPTSRWTSQGCYPLTALCCGCIRCRMDLRAVLCLACWIRTSSNAPR